MLPWICQSSLADDMGCMLAGMARFTWKVNEPFAGIDAAAAQLR